MQRLRLAAFGNSLYLEGIGACLEQHNGLTVDFVDPDAADARLRLDELAPDVIAFELGGRLLDVVMELLRQRPGLTLVALDRESEEILVLSGRRAQPTTASDLVDVLARIVPQAA